MCSISGVIHERWHPVAALICYSVACKTRKTKEKVGEFNSIVMILVTLDGIWIDN
jgi:hypothetical protein